MKTLFVLLPVTIYLFACNLWALNHKQKSENKLETLISSFGTDDCGKVSYRHKSEAEIAAMTPAQRIDELIKEQVYHMPAFDNYSDVIKKYIRKDGVKILPVLTRYLNEYNPESFSKCKDLSVGLFTISSAEADDLDNSVIRLRGTKEGKLTIKALERGIERMRKAGFDKDNHEMKSDFNLLSLHLNGLKGINVHDEIIMNTLRARHKVQITESEILMFSNFLTSLDPSYPSWSKIGGQNLPPVLDDSKKHYEAYLKFKAKK